MRKAFLTFLVTLVFFTASGQEQKTAPIIINTIPSFGDCNVNPELKEIIFKFNQDMDPGMSIPDNKDMPKITGRPTWLDKRTLSVPVQLDSNKIYTLFCNSWKFRNFKNINGIPLNLDFLIFQTKGDYEPDFSQKTYNEFIEIFPKRYSYASKNQLNWTAIIEQNRLAGSKTNTEFALKLINVLKNAEDPHLTIEYKGQKYSPFLRKFYVANYNINEIFKELKEAKVSEGKNVISGKYGDIGYICIGTWDNSRKDEIRTAIDRLQEFESLQNIIIDVRTNAGGDEELAKEFASCFIEKPVPYGLVKSYNQQTGKFDAENIKRVEPNKSGFIYRGKVYVLTGPGGLSSNESFVLMMKQVENAKIVGMRTYGSSGNPKPYKLSEDITLYLPSWQACTLDNELIEGHGIEPDIAVINAQSDFIGKDALFDEVIDLIKINQLQPDTIHAR